MKFKHRLLFVLIILGILVVMTSVASAGSSSDKVKVTVEGVNFYLHPDSKIIKKEKDMVIFEVSPNVKGYLTNIEYDYELNNLIKDDLSNGYTVNKVKLSSIKVGAYGFINLLGNDNGYFLIFKKSNKKFVYSVYSEMSSSNKTLEHIIHHFKENNKITLLDSTMTIKTATIVTGSDRYDKTNCTVFVGKEYAGKSAKISILYSNNGENLNHGKIVSKKVTGSGEMIVPSADAFEFYPDKAKITIYDKHKTVLDTQTVRLKKNSKPQSFYF